MGSLATITNKKVATQKRKHYFRMDNIIFSIVNRETSKIKAREYEMKGGNISISTTPYLANPTFMTKETIS